MLLILALASTCSAASFSQWVKVSANDGQFLATSPGATIARNGAIVNNVYKGAYAVFKTPPPRTMKCLETGYGDIAINSVKSCDSKPGDVSNLRADFFNYLGTVDNNGAVVTVADNDPRWVFLGNQGNVYDLPADGKVYIVRWGIAAVNSFSYRNYQGRVRCSDQYFPDPTANMWYQSNPKQCWYFSQPNDYLSPVEPTQRLTAKGEWVDCAFAEQDCAVQTAMRPLWIRLMAPKQGGGYASAFILMDSPNIKCSSTDAFFFKDQNFMAVANSQWSGPTAYKCSWFNPESFHFDPVGSWAPVVSGPQGATLSFSLTYGVDSSMANVESSEYSWSVTVSVESEAKFFGSGVKTSISSSYASSVASSMEKATAVSSGRECAISSCLGDPSWTTNVMWAWKMDIGEVCSWGDAGCYATVNTCNFWCTSSFNKPPKCPLGACQDMECQVCNPWQA